MTPGLFSFYHWFCVLKQAWTSWLRFLTLSGLIMFLRLLNIQNGSIMISISFALWQLTTVPITCLSNMFLTRVNLIAPYNWNPVEKCLQLSQCHRLWEGCMNIPPTWLYIASMFAGVQCIYVLYHGHIDRITHCHIIIIIIISSMESQVG